MKNLCTTVLGVCLTLLSVSALAQNQAIPLNEPDYNKPKLFSDLPETISFDPTSFLNLFQLPVGQSVTVSISSTFNYSGVVVSKASDAGFNSIVIRSTNRIGSSLTFTRVVDTDNSVRYIGRILSMQHGDAYEIVKDNDQYILKKRGIYDLYNE